MGKYLNLLPNNIVFLLFILIFFILIIFKVALEGKQSSFSSYKIRKLDFVNLLWLWLSFVVIIYSSSILYNWFLNNQNFSKIENYLILTLLIIIISVFFSVAEWLISFFIKDSFILLSQYQENLKKKHKNDYDRNNQKFGNALEKLSYIKENIDKNYILGNPIEDNITIILDFEDVKYDPKYTKFKYSIYDININDVKIVERHRYKNIRHYGFTYHELEIFIISGSFVESLECITEYTKVNKNGRSLEYLIKLIESKEKIIQKEIEFEKEMFSSPIFPLFDIVMNNMYELFSIRQGYYIPNNTTLKVTHFFFGVYKYIFLGSLITLLIQNKK